MKLIYTHDNSIVVGNANALLQQEGIRTQLRNEFASGAVGELSAIDSWPEIWVSDLDEERARIIVERLFSQSMNGRELREWQCLHCSEKNEPTFEICWHCQTPQPIDED